MSESKLRSGINWSFIAVMGRHAVQFLSTIALARLLVPNDFGLAAMVGTMTNFLSFFLDFGLSWVTIQREKLEDQQISNLFWINTIVGAAIGLVCLIISPAIADFYNQPTLTPFLYLQSLTFLFFGMAIQPMAYMKRHMKFRELAISDVGSSLFGTLMTIAMAASGVGVFSLILPSVVTHALRTTWVIWQSKIPIFRLKKDDQLLSYFHVGGRVTFANFFFYFARNLDDILTGRFFGSTSLGFYSRAYLLANLPSQLPAQTLSNVVISAVSRQRESGDKNWYETYRRVLIGFSCLVSPIAAGIGLTSVEAVRLIYGEKWAFVAPLLFWLSMAGIFQPAYNSTGWLLISLARYRTYFWWSLLSAVVLALGFIYSLSYDVKGMAISYFIVGGLLLSVPSQYLAHRLNKLSFRETGLGLLKIYISVAIMSLVVIWSTKVSGLPAERYLARLILMAAVGSVTYALCIRLLFKELPINFKSWLQQGLRPKTP